MRELLDTIAHCLTYPKQDAAARAGRAEGAVASAGSTPGFAATAASLAGLRTWLGGAPEGSAEERYTNLFDLSPVCTLNLGYHLFGETYERGALLAGLTAEMAAVGLEAGDELPDHLGHVLRLLGRVALPEDRELLMGQVLLPGLNAITGQLEDASDPWSAVLRSLPDLLLELAQMSGLEVVVEACPRAQRLPMVDGPGWGTENHHA